MLAVSGTFIWFQQSGVRAGVDKQKVEHYQEQQKSDESTKNEENRLRKIETADDRMLDDVLSYWLRP